MNPTNVKAILEKALKNAQADDVVAILHGGNVASTRMADNLITQNVQRDTATLYVECAFGQQHGSASTDDLSDESLKNTVERAQSIAKASPADEEYMPPVPAAETEKHPKVDRYCETTANTTPEDKARALAGAADEAKKLEMRLSGGYRTGAHFLAVANSAGLNAYHTHTDAELHATALGEKGSGWAEQVSESVTNVDVQATASRALAIGRAAQDPKPIEPGKYDVILSPAAIGELLLSTMWWGMDAKATDEGRTFLREKLGTQLLGKNITLRSDPTDARCPGGPFQSNGLVAPTLPWVEKGVVKNLFYSRFWAKKQGKPATGRATNFLMEGGDTSVKDMIASIERGLLVNRFWYIRHVDPMVPLLTGMTRDGLFLIEDGQIVHPVRQMRFNENTVDMLNRVETLGPVERTAGPPMLMPTIKVKQFNFDSETKF